MSCSFSSFEQCLEDIGGVGGMCSPNPSVANGSLRRRAVLPPRRAVLRILAKLAMTRVWNRGAMMPAVSALLILIAALRTQEVSRDRAGR
jgi:hypothetical protein